jgi:hypothetical protein
MQQSDNLAAMKKAKTEFVADGPLLKCDGIALATRAGPAGLASETFQGPICRFSLFDIHNHVISSLRYRLNRI